MQSVPTMLIAADVRNHHDINETRNVLVSNFATSTMVQVVVLARPELLLEIKRDRGNP